MSEQRSFLYRGMTRAGTASRGTVSAPDERAAMRRLAGEGLIITEIRAAPAARPPGKDRGLKQTERVLVLRQLALMLEAGVSLLEALDTVAQGMTARKGQAQFQAMIAALRRGENLGQAFEEHVPGFPFYVYAMARVGEASGRIAAVLKDAAEQMAYEDRLRKDFQNALTYPAFLLSAGVLAVGFIFTQVVPRFGAMIGDDRTNVPARTPPPACRGMPRPSRLRRPGEARPGATSSGRRRPTRGAGRRRACTGSDRWCRCWRSRSRRAHDRP